MTHYLRLNAHQALSEDILTQLVAQIDLPFASFNTQNQEKLYQIISQLPNNLSTSLREQLGLTSPASKPKTTQIATKKPTVQEQSVLSNHIFKAIYDKDLPSLERLLGINPFSPKGIPSPSTSEHRFNFNLTPRARAISVSADIEINNKR